MTEYETECESLTSVLSYDLEDSSICSESNDLDYDMWEGQFEFIGMKNINGNFDKNFDKGPTLNLSTPTPSSPSAHRFLWFDNMDEMNNDVQMLQQQVTTLADTQTNTDDRYTRVKTDNAVLQTRVHMLEEQLRDIELRGDERIQEEQRRHKEIIVRVEREAQLKQENCTIRLHTLELECVSLREEAARLRSQNDKQKTEIVLAEDRLEEARGNWALAQQELDDALTREKKLLAAKDQSDQLMQELSLEIERLRADHCLPALPTTMPEQLRLEELHEEMKSLREKNQNLKETNEELEAEILSRSVEEGRTLLNGTSNSLAAEFEAMSHDQRTNGTHQDHQSTELQMQKTMRDLQDENVRLRSYIDDILLNIVENYPQLLEVKRH